jgi:hypothetical protein
MDSYCDGGINQQDRFAKRAKLSLYVGEGTHLVSKDGCPYLEISLILWMGIFVCYACIEIICSKQSKWDVTATQAAARAAAMITAKLAAEGKLSKQQVHTRLDALLSYLCSSRSIIPC